jgi:hypothetical protein
MLNTMSEFDQAEGLRLFMLKRSKRHVSVYIPGSDFDRQKIYQLVRKAMNLRAIDDVSEALLADIPNLDVTSTEVIICVNHTSRSITEAYGIIKTLRASVDYLSIGVFVLAQNLPQSGKIFDNIRQVAATNLDVDINMIGNATIQAVMDQKMISAHASYTNRRLSDHDALIN